MAKSYLSQLRFDPDLLNTIWAKYLANIRLPIILIITIIALGINAYFNLPRRLNPEIKIPIVIINTVLPGAGSEDIESLITIPLEDSLGNIDGIDTITSVSSENSSTITIQFLSTVDGDDARSDVQAAVDTVNNLPEDATTPSVAVLDFENQPIWTFSITHTKGDIASLMRFSDNLQEQLTDLPKIDRVETSGLLTRDIEVIINLTKMTEFGLNPIQLSQAIRSAATAYPLGTISSGNSSFALTINKDITTIEDIRNIRIATQNQSVYLKDIATIIEQSPDTQRKSFLSSSTKKPQQAVQFFVYKTANANIDAAEEEAREEVEQQLQHYPGQFSLTTVENTAELITEQFDDLLGEFATTILLVFTLLLVFLGVRQALIASLTVPLTFLSTFAIINVLGLSLNFLTMFALLIALGLLIDDTIVVVAAMTRYYRSGAFTPYQTGVMVWRDFIVPLWSTTITTIWAFLPLLIAQGIIGEFIKSIPIVVTATMVSSTSIAVLITLPLMILFLKPQLPRRVVMLLIVLGIIAFVTMLVMLFPKNVLLLPIIVVSLLTLWFGYTIRETFKQRYTLLVKNNPGIQKITDYSRYTFDHGLVDIEKLSNRYRTLIDAIISSKTARRKTLIAIVTFAVIAYILAAAGLVKNEFFPSTDAEIIYINVELPAGTNVYKTTQEALSLTEQVRKTEVVDYLTTDVGQQINASTGGRGGSTNTFLLTLHLPPIEKREITSIELAQRLRERYANYTAGKLVVQEQSGGPPAGADIQIQLLGNDLNTLDELANQIMAYLEQQPGITNVDKSIQPGTSRLVFVPDKTKLVQNNITVDTVSLWLRTHATGFTLETITFGDDEINIILRTDSQTQTPETLGSVMIPTTTTPVPLLALGTITLETNPTVITRQDRKRSISVSAAVVAGTTTTEANNKLLTFVETLNFPPGYSWTTGGVNEENQRSVNSILQAMVISILLILITMVIEFGSFRQTLIAILIIPLSVAGVLYVFALTATPLSFPALIGILALFGIVVTHVIVVIEKINDNRKHGMELQPAIVDAAANRLEPVLLTSMATIVGLIPITLSDPLWRGLGGAIIAGLLFSGAIKLFFVPVVYYSWFHANDTKSTKKTRE